MTRKIPIGKCFEFAYQEIKKHPDAILVHGHIVDPWDHAIIEHAWIERKGKAYDWQMLKARGQRPILRQTYYNRFAAVPFHKYTQEEAFIKVLKHRHTGPWEKM